MYKLSSFLTDIMGIEASEKTEMGIYCMEVDTENTFRANQIIGRCACNAIMLVVKGWSSLVYDGRELMLTANDLFVYTPGLTNNILSASTDYQALCLLADEDYTLDTPALRDALRAAYLPFAQQLDPIFALSDTQAQHLAQLMRVIIRYIDSDHLYKPEALRTLYSLFLLDVIDAQNHSKSYKKIPERTEDIFVGFMKLLPQHFVSHRDIEFYASRLNISPTYLSRIVKQFSGRTVMENINQMLLTEAIWLLQQPELNMAQIADKLHFASQSSFTKFFNRMKGISPKAYRNRVRT